MFPPNYFGPVTVSGGGGDPSLIAEAVWAYPNRTLSSGAATPFISTLLQLAQATSFGGVEVPLSVFQNTQNVLSCRIVDSLGVPINLLGHTIHFILHAPNTDIILFTVSGGNIVLAASDPVNYPGVHDKITITIPQSVVLVAGVVAYKIRDITGEAVYQSGPFAIKWAP